MQVEISGYAWLDRAALTPRQVSNIVDRLTIQPKQTSDVADETPQPIQLYRLDEARNKIGVPRGFYKSMANGNNTEEVLVSYGAPMRPLTSTATFTGRFAEQATAIDALLRDLLGDGGDGNWGGALLQAQPAFGKTVVALEVARRLGRRTLILVHQDFFVRQWTKRIRRFLPDARIGIIRQDKCEYELTKDGEEPDFVIALLQSLTRDDGDRYPAEMYQNTFGLVISDECVDGDAKVETDRGLVPLCFIVDSSPMRVLSFDGSTWAYRKVVRGWKKGKKRTIEIRTTSGKRLRVTPEHLIRTEQGWMRADALTMGTRIMCPAVADVEHSSLLRIARDARGGLFSGTRPFRRSSTTMAGLPSLMRRRHSVPADVENASLWRDRCFVQKGSYTGNGVVVCQDTTLGNRCSISQKTSERCSLEPCLEIRASRTRIVDRDARVSRSTMVLPRNSGHVTRRDGCHPFGLMSARFQTSDMERSASAAHPSATPNSSLSVKSFASVDANASPASGSMLSRTRPWRGGIWMTGTSGKGTSSRCTRKDIRARKLASSPGGSASADTRAKRASQRENIGSSCFGPNRLGCSSRISPPMQLPEWSTNFDSVEEVSTSDTIDVFDIEVEGAHCFVANGMLVHNCHRLGAATWGGLMPKFSSAYRLGLTATPRRRDGAENVFFYHISQVTYEATTESVRPRLRRLYTDTMLRAISRGEYKVKVDNLNSAQIINQLCADATRTRSLVDDIVEAVRNERKIIVVSSRLDHLRDMMDQTGRILRSLDLPFVPVLDAYTGQWFTGEVWSTTTKSHRKGDPKLADRTEEDLDRAESANAIFATQQMVLEGLDIPALDVIMFTTPISDVQQGTGRVQRECVPSSECVHYCPWRAGRCTSKPEPIVTDVVDERIPRLRGMAARRERFYKTCCTM